MEASRRGRSTSSSHSLEPLFLAEALKQLSFPESGVGTICQGKICPLQSDSLVCLCKAWCWVCWGAPESLVPIHGACALDKDELPSLWPLLPSLPALQYHGIPDSLAALRSSHPSSCLWTVSEWFLLTHPSLSPTCFLTIRKSPLMSQLDPSIPVVYHHHFGGILS